MPLRNIAVKEIMAPEVPMAGPDTPVLELVDRMTERADDCPDFLVIVDEERRPLGIVTERELMSKALAEEPPRGQYLRNILSRFDTLLGHIRDYHRSRARLARDLMTSPAVCIDENASVAEAAAIMADQGLRQLPVLREGAVVGVLRRAHVVKAVAELYPRVP